MKLSTAITQMLPRFILLLAGVALVWFSGSYVFTSFVAGMVIGAVLRQLSLMVQAVNGLPLLLDVIDWNKIDRLLDEPEQMT